MKKRKIIFKIHISACRFYFQLVMTIYLQKKQHTKNRNLLKRTSILIFDNQNIKICHTKREKVQTSLQPWKLFQKYFSAFKKKIKICNMTFDNSLPNIYLTYLIPLFANILKSQNNHVACSFMCYLLLYYCYPNSTINVSSCHFVTPTLLPKW